MALLTPLMKAITGLLWLSASVLNMDSAWSAVATRTFDAHGLGLIGRFVAYTAVGLWFLLPGLFDRSLARLSTGPGRLVLDLLLLGLGIWLARYWLYLAIAPDSFLAAYLPRPQILAIGIFWGLGYLAAFLWPGYAFRRFAPAALPAPAQGAGANIAALTETAPPLPSVARQVGRFRATLMLAAVVPIVLGLPGFAFAIWMPSAETLALADRWWLVAIAATVLAMAVGTHGATLHLNAARLRTQGQAKVVLLGATAIFSAIAMTPFLTKTLPWAWSFAAGAEPVSVMVAVTHRGQRARRKGCDHVVTVAWPADPSRTTTICEVPRDLWQSLQPGDRLRLSGRGNHWGLTYAEVARAD